MKAPEDELALVLTVAAFRARLQLMALDAERNARLPWWRRWWRRPA